MKALRIYGPARLHGAVAVSGSKNAALPMLVATLLTDAPVRLRRVPDLRDISSMLALLKLLGTRAERSEDEVTLCTPAIADAPLAPYEIVRTMRASVLVLGPLLARHKRAVVSLPGGCAIGERPIDQHLKGLSAMGADIDVREGYVYATTAGLRGARITLDMPTVGGTENLMLAATMAAGETVIQNAAREPEIVALADLLRAMGADVEGDGTPTVRIRGVPTLHGADATVIPDRIEAGTLLIAAAATGGDVTLREAEPQHLDALLHKLRAAGATVDTQATSIRLIAPPQPSPVDIRTEPYPGFPTDLQAQWMALAAMAAGPSEVSETVFENRFMHVPELKRMGADIRVAGHIAVIHGGKRLTGAPVMATDLRASAGLVIAGLAADGITEVLRIYHLERGYERLADKLRALGADTEIFERDATVPHLELEPQLTEGGR